VQRSGIKTRYWVDKGDTGVSLAREAVAESAAESRPDGARHSIAIIYCTPARPHHFEPGNGVFLQRELGSPIFPPSTSANQCSGFIYGLSIADAWIRTGQYNNILLVGPSAFARARQDDAGPRHGRVIRDGAGAAVLGPVPDNGRGVLSTTSSPTGATRSCGRRTRAGARSVCERGDAGAGTAPRRDGGRDVFKFASLKMPESSPSRCRPTVSPPPTSSCSSTSSNQRIIEMVQKATACGMIRSTATSRSTATRPRLRFRSRSTRRLPRGGSSGAICSC